MSENFSLPPDALAERASAEVQRQAARMAQDAFSRLFRLGAEAPAQTEAAVTEIARRCANWARAGEDAATLRLALLASGIDQWALAWSQAFGLAAIPAVSDLLGRLRTGLDAGADARFQQAFAAIDGAEGNAMEFKIELRRQLHLALWHALAACASREEARPVQQALGSMMLALVGRMPLLGPRLVADALAHIQLRCLDPQADIGGLARELTAELFDALRASLPRELGDAILAQAGQAVVAWQRAQRAN